MTERRISYAQNGEDIVLARAFTGRSTGFYVDVGANEPTHDSVTRLFYDQGWSGLNIEPLPDCFARLQAERPRDINLPVGIGAASAELRLYAVAEAPAMSTFSPERARKLESEGYTTTIHDIEVVPLDKVFVEHVGERTVDFLKVDIEGLEQEVLGGFDWTRWRPRVLVVESDAEVSPWEQRLVDSGYQRTLWDGINLFFVRHEDAAELGPALSIPATTVLDRYDPWIYVEHLQRAETSCHEQLAQAQAAYENQLRASSAAYEERLRATSAAHEAQLRESEASYSAQLAAASAALDKLTEAYLGLALQGQAGLGRGSAAEAAGRALGRVLLIRPDVVERFGPLPDADLAGLAEWAGQVAPGELGAAELAAHRDIYRSIAKRARHGRPRRPFARPT